MAAGGFLGQVEQFFTGTKPDMNIFQNLDPQQQQLLNQLISQISKPVEGYTGALTAPINPLQQSSLAAMEQAAMNAASPTSGTATSTDALKGILNAQPQDLTSYFKQAFVDPAMQTFNQDIMPALEGKFKGLAGYGSDFATAAGRAASDTMTGIGASEADAIQKALQAQTQNKIGAATALSGVTGADTTNLLNLQAGGGVAQATEQAPLLAAYNEFQRKQAAGQANIQDILKALGVQTQTPVVVPGTAGFLQGAAGGVGAAATSHFLSN